MENNYFQNPEVSVIIPTYNRAHLIERAINSVINQTFKNFELLIIDDASKDNTRDIVNKYMKADARIKYLILEENQGESGARNAGIKAAQGKYIAFVDSDDEWLPTKLEKQITVFQNKDNPGLVYTGVNFINENTGEKRDKLAVIRGWIYEKQLAENPIGSPSRVMILRECFEKVGYFDPLLPPVADWEMWTRIAQQYFIDVVSEPLINYFEGYDDSTSVNADKLVHGYEAFWHKYNLQQKTNILAQHYTRLGHRLCYYGHLRRGRIYLVQALRLKHYLSPKCVILIAATLLGKNPYRRFTFLILRVRQ